MTNYIFKKTLEIFNRQTNGRFTKFHQRTPFKAHQFINQILITNKKKNAETWLEKTFCRIVFISRLKNENRQSKVVRACKYYSKNSR